MPANRSDTPVEDMKRLLAHVHGQALHEVEIRGLVPGEDARGYARFFEEAVRRAWRERGNRPLPPGYTGP